MNNQVRLGLIFGLPVFLIVMLVVGLMFGLPAYNRYQKRANAHNAVSVAAINIRNYAQQVKIAKQQAHIRYQQSVGIRQAQDEISRTLTPLYVQFEMVDALKAIATSGSNNSVVYIPAGANGIPLVTTANPSRVTRP